MPLEILGILVVAGVGGIALLLHLLGLSRRAEFADEAAARAAWLREYPDDAPGRIHLFASRDAALVERPAGPGLVWAFGADTVARPLARARIRRRAGDRLTLAFGDYATPAVTLTVTEDEAALLADRLDRDRDAA